MNAYQIIAKKRDGRALAADEIAYFVQGYAQNKIPDYQMSALLMAIYMHGMSFDETAVLTRSMLESGIRMNFKNMPGRKIDKHSTGGVGDKVSLILAPLVAAAGVRVPMISGRGLGHSGGTLDKLDAIPGFRTHLSIDEFYQQVEEIGVAMIGQTERICPADKKMYALRDATATIESIPLITSSILSKKLAEGIDGLVLDVKTGRGAFMKNADESRILAESLVKTAALNNLPTTVFITRMDEPLGCAAGNWLETREAIDCLKGGGPADVRELTLALGAQMLLMAQVARSEEEALARLAALLDSGAAFQKFCQLVEYQKGDVSIVHEPDRYPRSRFSHTIHATQDGSISDIDALAVGSSVIQLGGGRQVMEDQIDYKAGVLLHCKVGDGVTRGQTMATIYTDCANVVAEAARALSNAFVITSEPVQRSRIVMDVVKP
ncbi:thymidine phosphorylase [candidate division KSB1 bacterium]|nr:thymidine phosphorylase [candidate division KSB1 bacterium]RQW02766.1 MAG: thymidine phosphorylase [candidate division KSB1 bacterium]